MTLWLAPLAAFLAALAVGFPLTAPGLVAGDGPELASAAFTWGITHPTGYPFWTLLAHGLCALPVGCPAFRVTLLSLVGWAGGIAVLGAALARRWNGPDPGRVIGYGIAFFIALGPLALDQATGPEVYGLHFFISACLLALVLEPSRVHFALSCFFIGLGLAHHHTLLLVLPAWAWAYRSRFKDGRESLSGAAFASIGISLYLLLPIRSHAHPFNNWAHPDTWPQFLYHLSRHQYGGDLSFSRWQYGFRDMMLYAKDFALEGWVVLAVLVLAGIFRKEWKKSAAPLLGMVGIGVVLPWLIQTVPNPENNQIMEVFFPPLLLWASPLFLDGTQSLLEKSGNREIRRGLAVLGILLLAARVGWAILPGGQSRNLSTDRLGRDYLLNLPGKAVIYGEGDTALFPLAYMRGVLGLRPDLEVFDRTGGLFENIYRILDAVNPGGHNYSDLVLIELDRERKNPDQPVFYTETEYVPGRLLAINGLLFRASKDGIPVPAPRGLWPRFREPLGDFREDYLSRETDARYYVFRAANSIRTGMAKEYILSDFSKAAAIAFDNSRLLNNIGMELSKAGWKDNAAKYFRKTVDLDPMFGLGWYNLALVASDKGQPVESEEMYRRCLKADPYYSPARDGLAVVLYRTGRLEEAVDEWTQLFRRDQTYVPAFRNFGIAVLQADPVHARMLLEQYLRMAPNAPDRAGVIGVLQGKQP